MPDAMFSPNQRRTDAARHAFRSTFASDEERSAFYRRIGAKGNANRVVLSGDEVEALGQAYALLARIAERVQCKNAEAE